ncbi:related to oxysterol binding protein [Ramularia collo-cygni]|uniref:Related to oxysterol binding protein n=1 Tax=Ramularia collo-cygni TaxID=112498 RepID=A0A2D3UQC7_9PEZI|nr:related to oxysterol binding protein [Ramularia collo-cygni]CZT15375.1 related to oxysterol binding protein [Ramularia collo-cygni]
MAFGKDKKAADATAAAGSDTDASFVSAKNSVEGDNDRPQTASSGKDAASVPTDGQVPSDTSKLRTFLGILRRFIGVTDIAAVRFSLPAQLLEPIPNLEYWHYLDRPETFAAIGDSEDPLERMLGCLRFWFTKDLKYVKGKPCKPYNSALGEFFRCTWEVEGNEAAKTTSNPKPVKVNYLTEQTSHHPPVSAFIYECPEKGVEAVGYDQLSAKFTGTSVKVTPGQHNQGIFIRLRNRDNEEYQLTHPAAFLGGFLRGNLYITVADTCYVTCKKTGLKTILHYLEEGYFGKTQNKVEGIVYKPADISKDSVTRLKDVPTKEILGRIEGVWTEKLWFSKGSAEFKKTKEADRILLMDVTPLLPIAKQCPPEEHQLPNESRKFWGPVTEHIQSKQFGQATTKKQELEERQRERAAERAAQNKEWKPRFFTTVTEGDGKPVVSGEGKAAMEGLQKGDYKLSEPEEYGAL